MAKRQHVGSFVTRDDHGGTHEIQVYQHYLDAGIPGMKELVTSDGAPVNRISKGTYEILGALGKIIVQSDSRDAP